MRTEQAITAYCYNRRGQLISTGKNSYDKTHPLQAYFSKLANMPEKIFLHAEMDALLKARGKKIHSIHIVRIGKQGENRLAAPCPVCQLAIKAFGVKEITYTI